MKERNVTVTLDKAREWFNSGDATLREVALQAFTKKNELVCTFNNITTLRDACHVLGITYLNATSGAYAIGDISKASAAMFKLNIIRKALNFGHDLSLTKDPRDSYIYYPYNPFITKSSTYYKREITSGDMEIIGKIKSEGKEYYVLGGGVSCGGSMGLGSFTPSDGIGRTHARFGFLGCASKEIAQHFGKYFGMLITEAKYADTVKDFEIVESKYAI